MKITTKLLAGAVAVAIGGLAMTSIASATATVIHYPDSDISYTLNSGYSTQKTFTGVGTITISDGTDTITILDRNLGATAAGTGCEDSERHNGEELICPANDPTYGYYFFWGNNYGFDANTTPISDSGDYLEDLWGGSIDEFISSTDGNNWQVNNATGSQGPCPDGFHVPSAGELVKIFEMLSSDGDRYSDSSVVSSRIHTELLVPFAGLRGSSLGGSLDGLGYQTYLWSSSPYYSEFVYLYLDIDNMDFSTIGQREPFSLRCFYDSYDTYTPASSSEGGNSEIVVNIGKFNNGQNTCTGQDFIFSGIFASPATVTRNLVKTFQCAFGDMGQKAVTLQLSGDLTDGNGNTIPASKVRLKNTAWVGTPVGVKGTPISTDSYTGLNNTITLFNKAANKIGIAEGTGVDIQIEIPGGTPNGTYNGVLILSY